LTLAVTSPGSFPGKDEAKKALADLKLSTRSSIPLHHLIYLL
jgi:hypothetical protein